MAIASWVVKLSVGPCSSRWRKRSETAIHKMTDVSLLRLLLYMVSQTRRSMSKLRILGLRLAGKMVQVGQRQSSFIIQSSLAYPQVLWAVFKNSRNSACSWWLQKRRLKWECHGKRSSDSLNEYLRRDGSGKRKPGSGGDGGMVFLMKTNSLYMMSRISRGIDWRDGGFDEFMVDKFDPLLDNLLLVERRSCLEAVIKWIAG